MCDKTAMTAKRKLWVEWVRILSPFSVLRSFAVTTKSKPTAIIALSRSFLWLNPTKFQPFGFTAPSVQFVSKWALTFGLKISDLKPTHPPTHPHSSTHPHLPHSLPLLLQWGLICRQFLCNRTTLARSVQIDFLVSPKTTLSYRECACWLLIHQVDSFL